MADPRAPADIASFPTEIEANAFAALLRDQGIQAAVFGRGASFTGFVGECWDWRLMVPAEDADRARQVILEAREEFDAAVVVKACPGCEYSMEGLEEAERCPECGLALSEARENLKTRGLIIHETPARSIHRTWTLLWIVLAVCAGTGLITIILEDVVWGWNTPWVEQHLFDRARWAPVLEAPPWWTPLPLGLIAIAVGAIVVLRRRRARKSRAQDTGVVASRTSDG